MMSSITASIFFKNRIINDIIILIIYKFNHTNNRSLDNIFLFLREESRIIVYISDRRKTRGKFFIHHDKVIILSFPFHFPLL